MKTKTNMRLTRGTIALLALLCLPFRAHTRPPIQVQPGVAQLFVDDVVIERASGLRRTLHQPAKDNGGNSPLIAARERDNAAGLREHRARYPPQPLRHVRSGVSLPADVSADFRRRTRLAAQHPRELERVSLDLTFSPLPPEARGRPGIDLFSCYYDTNDAARPYKGWVWAANVGNEWEGIWYVDSADGLRWRKGRQVFSGYAGEGDPSCRAITQDGRTLYGPGDVTLFAHDPVENRFLGLFKFYSPRDARAWITARGPGPTRSWTGWIGRSTSGSWSASN